MDRRERYNDPEEALRIVMAALQSRIWTAMPGIVQSFNAAQMTVAVQPTVNGRQRNTDGTYAPLQMPLLLDCPVLWQGGGGATLTFPIAQGDECLVVFASRCIDAWWAHGGIQNPPEFRMHNLSDGFALVGVRSLPRAYAPNTSAVELRSDDGTTFFRLNPAAKTVDIYSQNAMTINSPGGITMNGVTVDSSGNVTSPATVTGQAQVVAGTGGSAVHLTTHKHPTAAVGSPSAPTPGT